MPRQDENHLEPFADHIYQPIQSSSQDQEETAASEQDRSQLAMDSQIQRYLTKIQVLTPLSILLNVASLAVCSILTPIKLGEINKKHWTQFTPNPAFILAYWAALFLFQIGFAILVVLGQKDFTKVSSKFALALLLA